MCGINGVEAQGCGCLFTFCHAYLKMGVLLQKMAIVCKRRAMTESDYFNAFNFKTEVAITSGNGPYGPKKLPRTNSSYSGNGRCDFINSNGHLVLYTLTLIYHKKEILGSEC